MSSIIMLPSGRFRAFAKVRTMREAQVFDRRNEAEKWATATEKRMHAGKWSKAPKDAPTPPPVGITVAAVVAEYIQTPGYLKKASTTRDNDPHLQRVVLEHFGTRPIREVTRRDVEAFIAVRQRTQTHRDKLAFAKATKEAQATWKPKCLSGHEIRLEVAALAAVCKYAIRQDYIEINPTKGAEKPAVNRRTERIEDELLGRIMDHDAIFKDGTAYMFFRILFTSVCRPGELANARRTWLRADPPQIVIPRTKNDDPRTILLTESMQRQLAEHIASEPDDCPFIFGTRKLRGPGWSPYNYSTPWKKVAKDLGLKELGIVAYHARHEGISRLFERTKLSDGQIAGLSGHRSAQALWHYKHLRNEHQRPVMAALDRMVHHAIDRVISHLAPGRALRPGEMLVPDAGGELNLSDNAGGGR